MTPEQIYMSLALSQRSLLPLWRRTELISERRTGILLQPFWQDLNWELLSKGHEGRKLSEQSHGPEWLLCENNWFRFHYVRRHSLSQTIFIMQLIFWMQPINILTACGLDFTKKEWSCSEQTLKICSAVIITDNFQTPQFT